MRPGFIIGIALRMVRPQMMARLNKVNESTEITFEKTKVVFGMMLFGYLLAILLRFHKWLKHKILVLVLIQNIVRKCKIV